METLSEAVSCVRHSRYQHVVCILGFFIPLCCLSEVAVFVLSELFVGAWQKEFITMLLVVFFFFAGSASGTKTAQKQMHKTKVAASTNGYQASRQGKNVRDRKWRPCMPGQARERLCFPTNAESAIENIDEVPRTRSKVSWFEQIHSDAEIIVDAQRDGFTLDASNFPTVFEASVRQGNAGLSTVLFKYMVETGTVISREQYHGGNGNGMVSKFFNIVAQSLDEECLQEAGAKLIEAIRAHGLAPSSIVQNCLIRAWRSNPPDHVVRMFMALRERGVRLCPTVYRCILAAYERTQPQLTLDLYDEMVNRQVKFDRVGLNAVLCACSMLGQTDQAVKLYEMIHSHGLVPNGKTYGLMIRVYTAAHMPNEALNIWESMRAANIDPNRYAFDDAIQCYIAVKMPGKAISLYQEMIRAGVSPCENTVALYLEMTRANKAVQDAGAHTTVAGEGVVTPGQRPAAQPAGPGLLPGAKVTVRSPSGTRRVCTVRQVDADRVRVCYEGLSRFQVEWLPKDSSRIVAK